MSPLKTLFAVSAIALVSACASTGEVGAPAPMTAKADEHAGHQPEAAASAPMAAMDERMKAMAAMRDRMANATSPAERQALMAEHMEAMRGGMQMMKSMQDMPGMQGMGGGAGMGDPKAMQAEMAKHHQMTAERMAMMQMMMEMMMQRMPPAGMAGK